MVKAPDIATNADGTGLVVADVAGGQGPLMEPITGADVKGLTMSGDNVVAAVRTPKADDKVAE